MTYLRAQRWVVVAITVAAMSAIRAEHCRSPWWSDEQDEPALAAAVEEVVRDRGSLLARLGVAPWHTAGHRGRGVTVAILDTGFRGYRSYLGRGLPGGVRVRSFRSDGELEARDSQHGILCAEIIHTIAPDASLVLATWEPDQPQSFVRAVAWAKSVGAKVVSCSVVMPSWSDGEGGGPIHADLTSVMGGGQSAADVLGVACAGNTAQRHWRGQYLPDSRGFHQWRPAETDNAITPWEVNERVSVELCCPAGASFSIELLDALTRAPIGIATTPQGSHSTVLRFIPTMTGRYAVRVRHVSGPAAAFHLSVLGGWLDIHDGRGSIPFPADGTEFMAIGAVDPALRRISYSSCGPNGPAPKPDFMAAVPVLSAVRGTPFAGTSAAAPQAAGLAALCLSRYPDWSPDRVRALLRNSSLDLATPGHDVETGYGLLRLPGTGLGR